MTLSPLEPQALNTQMHYAEVLAQSNLLPRSYQRQPANVLLAIQMGGALGIPPIQAINSIHVIEGKPSASADLIASLVRRAGHKLRITMEQDGKGEPVATARLIRCDDPDFTFEARWDMDKARRANLTGKGTWKQYPDQMLRSRAITDVCRQGAGDALFGVVYTPEELERGTTTTVEQMPAPTFQTSGDVHMIEDGQRRRMWATAKGKGMTEEDFRAFIDQETGRTVESTNNLTRDEADHLIQLLDQLPEPVADAELVTDEPEPEQVEETDLITEALDAEVVEHE